jgi:hypothetical protein
VVQVKALACELPHRLGLPLSLIRTLARFHLKLNNVRKCEDPRRFIRAAAQVLSSYPDNFHKLLWTVGTQHGRERSGEFVSGRFGSIYRGIFRQTVGDTPQSRDFLGSAFLDFAMNQWGRCVHPKLLCRIQKTMPKRRVTFKEFRRLYGFGWEVARRVLVMKKIARTASLGHRERIVIDVRKLHDSPIVPGKILSCPYAAATIGVSTATLSKLRESGHFEVKHHIRRPGYHERHIEQFIERLLALNPSATNKPYLPTASRCTTLCADFTELANAVRASFVRSCPVNCGYWDTSTGQFEVCSFLGPNLNNSAGTNVLGKTATRERLQKSQRKYIAENNVSLAWLRPDCLMVGILR